MSAPRIDATARRPLLTLAREPSPAWEARDLAGLAPPATLQEARARRDELATLLGRERADAADFLLALADFDRRRGWERLGHASLFAFLTRELRLSSGAAQLRLSAARLLPRHPAVEEALRSGRLCISAVGQLARVLTPINEAEILPRFLGVSAREAQEVAAAILPCPSPPRREVVTVLPARVAAAAVATSSTWSAVAPAAAAAPAPPDQAAAQDPGATGLAFSPPGAGPAACPVQSAPAPLHTSEVDAPARGPERLLAVEPLTADLRRLHLTVSAGFLAKVAAARTGLSHTIPGASTEQVLAAALDLLLDQQARRKALVKRPRAVPAPAPIPTSNPPSSPHRPHIPAVVEREVRLRDGDRCQFPLDVGGTCGSTWQVELDHVVPLAFGGQTDAANLRCACRKHNRLAAAQALGPGVETRRSRRRGPASGAPGRTGA